MRVVVFVVPRGLGFLSMVELLMCSARVWLGCLVIVCVVGLLRMDGWFLKHFRVG